VRAMSAQGLPIDLRGKRAFIAGVADDNGYGWAIAKALAAAGAEILVGTWVPALNIFETSLRRGKFDESRKCVPKCTCSYLMFCVVHFSVPCWNDYHLHGV
jgi:enoyl-[acyl-carrier protein] reductase I